MLDLVSDIIGVMYGLGEANIAAREERLTRQQREWERGLARWEGPHTDPIFQVVLRIPYGGDYEQILIRDMGWMALAGAFPEHYERTWKGDVPAEWGRTPYNGALALAAEYMPRLFNVEYALNAWQWWIVPAGTTPAESPGWRWEDDAWVYRPAMGTETSDVNKIAKALGIHTS